MEEKKGNEIRDMPAVDNQSPQLMMINGRTTFLINLHFAEQGKETLESKIKRLILKDVQDENF